MAENLREYVVTLYKHEDLDSFYEDMETPGGNLYIPDRKVDVSIRRGISRNTNYWLTPSEADEIKKDPRVWDVALTEEEAGVTINPGSWTETNYYYSKTGNINDLPLSLGHKYRNWGLLRTANDPKDSNWGFDGTTIKTGSVTSVLDGLNVDIVISDNGVIPNHPELAVNSDGTGGSRVKLIDWYQYTNAAGYTGTYPTSGYRHTYLSSDAHGTMCAGVVAGNTQGWARKSNIYTIHAYGAQNNALTSSQTFDYIRVWHNSKSINPVTGRKNPTIVNASWGSGYRSVPINDIISVVHRGTTYNGPFTSSQLYQNYGIYNDGTTIYEIPNFRTDYIADVEDLLSAGVILVTSAGNNYMKATAPGEEDYNNTVTFSRFGETIRNHYYHRGITPGAIEGVINVGSTTAAKGEGRANYSTHGRQVKVWAPGSFIFTSGTVNWDGSPGKADPRSSETDHKFCIVGGTSFAAPQVAGVLACYAELLQDINQTKAFQIINAYKSTDVNTAGSFEGYDSTKNLQGAAPTQLGFKNPTFNLNITSSNASDNTIAYNGDTVTFTVTSTNVPDGSIVYLKWFGSGFFEDGTDTGTVIINNNVGTVTRKLKSTIPGTGPYTASLWSGSTSGNFLASGNNINLLIKATESYSIVSNSSISEGTPASINVITTAVTNGTVLYWTIQNNSSDFISSSGSVTINNNAGTFSITAISDTVTEGPETFTIALRKNSTTGTIVATSNTISINDTSTTPVPTYTLTPSKTTANEGELITVTVSTTNVPNNTTLYWNINSSSSAIAGDIDISQGTVTIQNNTASFSFRINNDLTTELTESLIFSLRTSSYTGNIVATSPVISINDTSRSVPTYTITPASSSVDEGNSLTFNISTTNVSNGTVLYWTLSDITQFNVGSGSVTINNNAGSFTVTPKTDFTTEGSTNFSASLRTNSITGTVVANSSSVTINDTSITTAYSIFTNNTNNDSSDVYPGDTITYTITTSGIANGTILYITNYPGTEASSFVDNLSQTTVTIQNNSATLQRQISASVTSPTIAKIHLRTDGYTGIIVAESDLLNVLPIPVSYTLTPNKTSVDEGSSISFTLNTNVPDGTLIYWSLQGNFNTSDFTSQTSGQAFINNGTASFVFSLKEDLTIESESFYLEIREFDSSGSVLATSQTIQINDTTVTPTGPTYNLVASSNAVAEGSPVTITLNTTNIDNNTLVRWIIAGDNVDSGDFIGVPSLEGNFNVVANTASVTFTLNADERTEGVEYFYLTLPDIEDSPILPISISDTSRTPTAELAKFYINSNTPVIDEGIYLYFQITATGLTSNITIPWNLQGIPTADILGNANKGNVTLLELEEGIWTGEVQIGILENFKTDGIRTAFLTINPGIPYVLEVSQSIVVKDTSLDRDPRYNLQVNKTRVIEGGNVTVTVIATNVPDNTIVPLQILPWEDVDFHPDEADFADIANVRQLYFPPLKNNTASYTATVLDDFKFEQTEYFYFNIPGTIASSQVVEIIDSGNTLITSNATFTGNIILGFLDKAVLTPEIGGLTVGASDWEDLSGKVSERIYVQGRIPDASPTAGIFYQPFSYVVRSSISIELWRDSIKKVLHPAGLALFSEIDTETLPGEEFNVEPKKDGPAVIQDFFALTADNARLPFCASNVKYTNTRFSVDLKSDFAYYIHKEL